MNPEVARIPQAINNIRQARDRVIVSSVAALSVMGFEGLVATADSMASPIPNGSGVGMLASYAPGETNDTTLAPEFDSSVEGGPTAHTAMSKKDWDLCWEVFGKNSVCKWGIKKGTTTPLPGIIRGAKTVCGRWSRDDSKGGGGNISCSISNSVSKTFKASVTGTAEFPWGTLSSEVGYELNRAVSVTTTKLYPTPKGTYGEEWYRRVFTDKRQVTQELRECRESGSYGDYSHCSFAKGTPDPRAIHKLITARFDSIEWGKTVHK